MELYEVFSSRVKDLCSAASYQLRLDPALQNESHIEGINAIWINLKTVISDAKEPKSYGEHWHHSGIGPGRSSFPPEHESSPLGGITGNFVVDGLPQRYELFYLRILDAQLCTYRVLTRNSNITQAKLYRRSAIKRRRLSSPSSSSAPQTGPSPSSSASSNTLSESSESENICCSICGFRPKGERKWYKRTMKRHIRHRHNPGYKEAHVCGYEGCERSFTRVDNLTQHQQNKRHLNPNVNFGTRGVNTWPKSVARNGL
jgi:hypothetical protein